MAEGLLNYTRLDDPDDVVCTTQGRPMCPDDEVRLVDELDQDVPDGEPGSLLTRGPYTPRGYYRAAEQNARAFTADGWYRSGDIVPSHAGGNLVVEGRDKDMINRGGEKISAEEVENLVYRLPEVAASRRRRDARRGARGARVRLRRAAAGRHADPRAGSRCDDGAGGGAVQAARSASWSSTNSPRPRSARSTRRHCAPTSPLGLHDAQRHDGTLAQSPPEE